MEDLKPRDIINDYESDRVDRIYFKIRDLEDKMKMAYRRSEFNELAALVDRANNLFLYPTRTEVSEESLKFQIGYIEGLITAYKEVLISDEAVIQQLVENHPEKLSKDSLHCRILWLLCSSISINVDLICDNLNCNKEDCIDALDDLIYWDLVYPVKWCRPWSFDLIPRGHQYLMRLNRERYNDIISKTRSTFTSDNL